MIKCRAVPVCTRHAGVTRPVVLQACLMVKHGKIFLKLVIDADFNESS